MLHSADTRNTFDFKCSSRNLSVNLCIIHVIYLLINLSLSSVPFFVLFYRAESVEKPNPVEKKYEPVPQVTPSLPPATLPKPTPEGKIYTHHLKSNKLAFTVIF